MAAKKTPRAKIVKKTAAKAEAKKTTKKKPPQGSIISNDGDNLGDKAMLGKDKLAVVQMIEVAKKRGFISFTEIAQALPENFSSDKIEDVASQLSQMGVNVVDSDDDSAEGVALANDESAAPEKVAATTDDPVRMYLREMGSVDLLSREGEIAIAKRIEAGQDSMLNSLCESSLTGQAIMIWYDELREDKRSLRDIIDLDSAQSAKPQGKKTNAEREDDDENNISLAMMEMELRPQVLAQFEKISQIHKRFAKSKSEAK